MFFIPLYLLVLKMKFRLILFFILSYTSLLAQEEESPFPNVTDSLYKEDQFYLGVTYNLLNNKPNGVNQNKFSSGFHFGFIRDMPINKKRNKAIGVGLGLSFNSYNQNLLISENNKEINFSVINDDVNYSKNKFYTSIVELPIEFRWRTSTAKEYNFWRIYTGVKFGYVFSNSSKYQGEPENIRIKQIDSFNTLQYGLTLSAGYSTWNFHLYYGLNPIFDNSNVNNNPIDMTDIKIGLMFYIL